MQDLFGNDVPPGKMVNGKFLPGHNLKRKSVVAHETLLSINGTTEGKKCGACKYFYFKVASKRYPKCSKSGCKGSTVNNDWSSRWAACGLFEPDND